MGSVRKIKSDLCGLGKVWISLTEDEYWQMKAARLAAWFYWNKCPADFMSSDLESILCGHVPERYNERI